MEKLGIPVAAIISMKDYENYRRLLSERQLSALGRKVGAEAERQGLTEEKLLEELKETDREVPKQQYGDLDQKWKRSAAASGQTCTTARATS